MAAREVKPLRHATGAIYGTILVTALVAGLSEDPSYGSTDILASVLSTAVVFWLAHVYARALGERLEGDPRGTGELTRDAMAAEWPLIQVAIPPCAALFLGAVGAYSRDSGVDLAIALGVASLFGYGFLFGRRLRRGVAGATLTGAVNALAGLVIVALKIAIH
jgi:hypothetical protein